MGQMSLWGATVITNLISAIPWIGQDVVEFTNNTEILNLEIIVIIWSGVFIFLLLITKPKFLGSLYYLQIKSISLPTIGIVNKNALKKNNKALRRIKEEYFLIPSPFLGFLVGLIDGDGYFQISKTPKGYITIKLVISLHLDDLATLDYISSVLKLGNINIYKDLRSPTCRLVINRTDLQEVLFPLLMHHNIFFLTNTRTDQFNLAMYILENDIKMYDEIPSDIPSKFKLPNNPTDYTLLPFLKNWIVGFTCSEGSFFIKSNNDGCFKLKQRMHTNLFEAFKIIFNTNRKIDTTNNFSQFGVSSKADIQKVINFFSLSGQHPLIGLKNVQYTTWLNNLRDSTRYNKLNYPS
jgi:hypothetical protein